MLVKAWTQLLLTDCASLAKEIIAQWGDSCAPNH